ncbi:Histone_H2A [Hexamita inflata]|uniref:Histone H2A n=1 Tax=Hexamita inflata TaxID=28002 RepID=A0AA86RUR3_9EUKA|nr:Histone H2A [Hexamita inflata]CAI9972937.1 Histone H2A [Hexamita inflata]
MKIKGQTVERTSILDYKFSNTMLVGVAQNFIHYSLLASSTFHSLSFKQMAFDKKSKSRSARAGVIFPVGRIHRHLKEGRYADRISSDAPVYMAAVLQQVVEEVFKEAETRKDNKATKRLVPNNILTAIRKDKELNDIFKDIVIREGGVPRSEKKEKSEKGKKSQE